MHPAILWAVLFSIVLAEKSPRLKFTVQEPARFHFTEPENYMTMYHQQGSNVLYVGGKAVIYMLNFTQKGVQETQISAVTDENVRQSCLARAESKIECDNFITVIEKVNDTFVVCGTNAGTPKCWLSMNDTVLTDMADNGQRISASDISPTIPSQRSVSLSADGSLYSALSAMGKQLGSIRRTYSSNKLLKTEDKWMLSEWAEVLQTVLKCAKESKQFNVSYNFVTAQSEDHILAFIIGPSAVHEPITFTFAAYLYSIYNIYVDKPCYTNC